MALARSSSNQPHGFTDEEELLFKPVDTFVRVGNVLDLIFSYLPASDVPSLRLVSSFWNFVCVATPRMGEYRAPLLNKVAEVKVSAHESVLEARQGLIALGLVALCSVPMVFFGLLQHLGSAADKEAQIAFGTSVGLLLPFVILAINLTQGGLNLSPAAAHLLALLVFMVGLASPAFYYLRQWSIAADAAARDIFRPECDRIVPTGDTSAYPATARFYDLASWVVVRGSVFSDGGYAVPTKGGGGTRFWYAKYNATHYPTACGFGYKSYDIEPTIRVDSLTWPRGHGAEGIAAIQQQEHPTDLATLFSADGADKYRRQTLVPLITSSVADWGNEADHFETVFIALFVTLVGCYAIVFLHFIFKHRPQRLRDLLSVTLAVRSIEYEDLANEADENTDDESEKKDGATSPTSV